MDKRFELGIALSGGGAKGAAHCGALQAIEEFGLHPDVLSGTSAGSIAAVLYGAGMSPVEICNCFMRLDFKDLLEFGVPRGGLGDSKPLVEHLRRIIPVERFEQLQTPVYIVASNLERGRKEVFCSGTLAERVTASCSIPLIFKPIEIDGAHYVDGGVFENMPVTTIRNMCRKVIGISVNVASEEEYRDSLLSVAMRSFYLMFMSNTLDDALMCDLFIEMTDAARYSAYDLSNITALFKVGYDTTVARLTEAGYERQIERRKVHFAVKEPKPSKRQKVQERLEQLSESVTYQFDELKQSVRKPVLHTSGAEPKPQKSTNRSAKVTPTQSANEIPTQPATESASEHSNKSE